MPSAERLAACLGLGTMLLAAAPALAQRVPAACPASPVTVVHSIGAPVEYRGTYPGLPELCFEHRPDGDGYFYFGIWKDDWPGAGLAYPALKTAITGGKSTRTEFITRSYLGLQWKDSITNEGIEPLVIDGHTYMVLRLAHEREGIEGNTYHSIITSWRDVNTGAALKAVENQLSGKSYGPQATWTATKVEFSPVR